MGSLKQQQLETEGLRRIAEEVGVRVGLLARCELCETTYDPLTNLHVESYRLANWLISHGDELVDGLGDEDRRPLTDMLKDICNDYPNHCRCRARGLRW